MILITHGCSPNLVIPILYIQVLIIQGWWTSPTIFHPPLLDLLQLFYFSWVHINLIWYQSPVNSSSEKKSSSSYFLSRLWDLRLLLSVVRCDNPSVDTIGSLFYNQTSFSWSQEKILKPLYLCWHLYIICSICQSILGPIFCDHIKMWQCS